MNNRKFFTTSVAVHLIVILGLIFWPKSDKNPEIIQSMEMVQAGSSATPVDLPPTPLDTPIPKETVQPPQDIPEIKPKAVMKESEEKVSLKKEEKKAERKIVKKPNAPPPLPKIKSVLKSKLNTLMEDKPAPTPPVDNKNWVDPNEKKNSPTNWIEPETMETPQPTNPAPNSINTDGSSPTSKEKSDPTGILPQTSLEETSDDGAFKFNSPSSQTEQSAPQPSSKVPETEPLTNP